MKKSIYLMGLALLTLCGCSNENAKVDQSKSDVVIETIMTRRSIRQYKDEPVSRELMESIVKCGINAPSGSNRQEWEIRVVDNPEFINGCTEAWKKTLSADRLDKMVDANFKNMFRNAPTVVFIACPKGTELNCGFLGQNMMLSAWSMGIGTCCLVVPCSSSAPMRAPSTSRNWNSATDTISSMPSPSAILTRHRMPSRVIGAR